MAGTVKHSKLIENRRTRMDSKKLTTGRRFYWQALIPGRAHLGYQRWPEDREGRWALRRYVSGKYTLIALGRADDAAPADGLAVLSYPQAAAKARVMLDTPAGPVHRMTVRQAFDRYVEFKRHAGQPVSDLLSRGRAHILPALGDAVIAELTTERLRRWLASLAASAAQTRPKSGKPQFKPAPTDDEDVRRRRASANRVLTMLKAALNHAYDEGHISNRDAWGRKLKPFRAVEVARQRFLSVAEAGRLLNACDVEFRPLVRAALETGARYGELARLVVADFHPDAGTLAIRKSKTNKGRHVILTPEGAQFFRQHCAGRAGSEVMFRHDDGTAWKMSEQGRPMRAACERAKLTPVISFHGLRHTWASLAVMGHVPLLVVARNLGHASTVMVEKHYGHLARDYVSEAIRAGAPRFAVKPEKKRVVPLR